MPNNRVNQTFYLGPVSSVESINEATQYKPGELGSHIVVNGKEYQKVVLDSGATSANAVGVVAKGQVAYWKSKSSYIVTNDFRQSYGIGGAGARNEIAGIFTAAVTAGNACVVQQRGLMSAVIAASGSPNAGDFVVGDNTASTAQVTSVAIATAPTVQAIGKVQTTQASSTSWPVELDVPMVE